MAAKTAVQRAMSDVDKVAEAICNAHDYRDHWHQLQDAERQEYRKVALAVIDVLGLTEETNEHFGDRYTDDQPPTHRRLVSPWQDIAG